MSDDLFDWSRRTRETHPIRVAVKAAVKAVLAERRGAARAITGDDLAIVVAERVDLNGWLAPKTLKRRCQEAVAALVAEGVQIASTSGDGYFTPETAEEIEAGARDLRQRLIGIAMRLRAFDRACADRILALLGQTSLGVEP